ncbi:MAG: hypothetical protein QXG82_07390 [Sulfolobales archaeon]
MDVSSALLIAYAALSLALPYLLSGDKSLTTFSTYVALSVIAIVTAYTRLKRWAKVE